MLLRLTLSAVVVLSFFLLRSLTYSIIIRIRQITFISLTINIASISSEPYTFFTLGRAQFICRIVYGSISIDGTPCMNNCQVLTHSLCVCVCERHECTLVKLFDYSKAPNKQRNGTNTRTNARIRECTDPKLIPIDYIKIHMNLFYYNEC